MLLVQLKVIAVLQVENRMLTTEDLADVFAEKLTKTKDFGQAFTKAVWIAFGRGYRVGLKECEEKIKKLEEELKAERQKNCVK
jgi:hypothetical protein